MSAGKLKYVKNNTIDLYTEIIIPHLEKVKNRDIGFSEALHDVSMEWANSRSLLIDKKT